MIVLGVYLWQLKNWARIGTIIIGVVNIIADIIVIIAEFDKFYIINIVITIWVIKYLIKNKSQFK
jgi:uncharacterized membrane protein HdeD (DUF308 family)